MPKAPLQFAHRRMLTRCAIHAASGERKTDYPRLNATAAMTWFAQCLVPPSAVGSNP
jgi:hypothetical protein